MWANILYAAEGLKLGNKLLNFCLNIKIILQNQLLIQTDFIILNIWKRSLLKPHYTLYLMPPQCFGDIFCSLNLQSYSVVSFMYHESALSS